MMPIWLMKTGDDNYRLWSTVVDDWASESLNRAEALAVAVERAWEDMIRSHRLGAQSVLDAAVTAGEDTLRFVDEHLCSCRARLGENVEIRNGVLVATGGGRLAYHFDSYDEVARFCQTQEQRRTGRED